MTRRTICKHVLAFLKLKTHPPLLPFPFAWLPAHLIIEVLQVLQNATDTPSIIVHVDSELELGTC